jgi:hypothetical protein
VTNKLKWRSHPHPFITQHNVTVSLMKCGLLSIISAVSASAASALRLPAAVVLLIHKSPRAQHHLPRRTRTRATTRRLAAQRQSPARSKQNLTLSY